MPICVLCQKRDADKTGSHIVPAFMLASLIGKRNKEIGFEISSDGYVKKYIGREVSAEKITELLDRELTDEDIAENDNFFTTDNLLCTECENRLGVLESACASELQKLKEGAIELQKEKTLDYYEHSSNLLLRCLFYSIILRISGTARFEYNLNPTLRERIRMLLDKILSTDAKAFQVSLKMYKDEITKVPFAIFYAPLGEDDGGNQIYSHKPLPMPSFVIINEFIVCLYNSMTQTDFDFGSVFTINKTILKEAINFRESVLRIAYLNSRKEVNASLNKVIVHKMLQNLGNLYRQVSIRSKGINPPDAEIRAFVADLATDETDLSDKLTPEYMAKIMMKHIS